MNRQITLEPYRISDTDGVATPALAIYPEQVDFNIATMLSLAGGSERWRPHVKTIKSAYVMRRLVKGGVTDWKCATPLELETACETGARDVLLAYPVTGANAERVRDIAERFPDVVISVLVEDVEHVSQWRDAGIGIFLDLNPGMDRTGADPHAIEALIRIAREAGEAFRGLHYYDGHLSDPDFSERTRRAHAGYAELMNVASAFASAAVAVSEVITSGTPAFPCALEFAPFAGAAFRHRVSPGTIVLNDATSLTQLPESYGFRPAALVLATVVSHPTPDRATCDGGHKAVSADAGVPTCTVVGYPGIEPLKPSEEHLPMQIRQGNRPKIGEVLYLLPRHICPTVNLFDLMLVVESGRIAQSEAVTARGH